MEFNTEEILTSHNEYIKNVPNGVRDVSNLFRVDALEKALQGVLDFSEGMTWLTSANKYLVLEKKIKEIDFAKITEFLLEINESLENQDYVLVADLFEYEIAPFFEHYICNL